MQLTGKRIIVTGGASGIGATLVAAYVAEGARVASLDLQEEAGNAVIAALDGHLAAQARFFRCDVSDTASVSQAFEAATAFLGGLDVLVNAAGIAPGAPAEAIKVEDWDRLFGINARGTFLTNQAAFAHLKERGGRILNFASSTGAVGYPGKAHYAATKGAVLAWTRSVAREWGRHGITVNAVAPGMSTPMYQKTRSEMTPQQLAEHDVMMTRSIPIDGKLGDPMRDLAPAMVFYASDGARYITGQTLLIDGGAVMLT